MKRTIMLYLACATMMLGATQGRAAEPSEIGKEAQRQTRADLEKGANPFDQVSGLPNLEALLQAAKKQAALMKSADGSAVQGGGQAAAPAQQADNERVLAQLRVLKSLIMACKREWLDHDARQIIFVVGEAERPAYEAIRPPLNLESCVFAADENGLVRIEINNDDGKIRHIRDGKRLFLSLMGFLSDHGALQGEALDIAKWARGTRFTYYNNSDSRKFEQAIEILTEDEYQSLVGGSEGK